VSGRVRAGLAVAIVVVACTPAFAQSLPPGFVTLRSVDPSIRQDMRYVGPDNFTGHALPGYESGECILQRAATLALKRVQADLAQRNFTLKVYDCYRPARAVGVMARWAANPHATPDTSRYYPRLEKRKLFALGYISAHSAHSRGVAVDLTIVPLDSKPQAPFEANAHYGPCTGPASAREPDDGVDMGTSFDCFDTKSWTNAGPLTGDQRARRDILVQAMTRRGFKNYAREWWHFSYYAADPKRAYDFPVR
jgi:zinc D-Ala-D-Ala dipeptidase